MTDRAQHITEEVHTGGHTCLDRPGSLRWWKVGGGKGRCYSNGYNFLVMTSACHLHTVSSTHIHSTSSPKVLPSLLLEAAILSFAHTLAESLDIRRPVGKTAQLSEYRCFYLERSRCKASRLAKPKHRRPQTRQGVSMARLSSAPSWSSLVRPMQPIQDSSSAEKVTGSRSSGQDRNMAQGDQAV